MCACAPLGALISCHVSSVFLISSPQGTGELFTRQYSLSLPTVSLVVLSGCVLLMILTFACTSLYCIFCFCYHHHPPPFSQRPKRITKSPWHFYRHCFLLLNFSGVIVQTGHRGDCRYFLRLGARQNPWKKDYGGGQRFSGGWVLARDGARLTQLCLYINHDRGRNPSRQSQRAVSSLRRL